MILVDVRRENISFDIEFSDFISQTIDIDLLFLNYWRIQKSFFKWNAFYYFLKIWQYNKSGTVIELGTHIFTLTITCIKTNTLFFQRQPLLWYMRRQWSTVKWYFCFHNIVFFKQLATSDSLTDVGNVNVYRLSTYDTSSYKSILMTSLSRQPMASRPRLNGTLPPLNKPAAPRAVGNPPPIGPLITLGRSPGPPVILSRSPTEAKGPNTGPNPGKKFVGNWPRADDTTHSRRHVATSFFMIIWIEKA